MPRRKTTPEQAAEAKRRGELLRQARVRAGLTQEELADRVLGPGDLRPERQLISKLERGDLTSIDDWIGGLAAALGVSAADLGAQGNHQAAHIARLVGYLGVGGMVFFDALQGPWGEISLVPCPPGADGSRAIEVKGSALEPRYDEGDRLFFPEHAPPVEECLGRECVVQTRDGAAFVGRLARAAGGRYTVSMVGGGPRTIDLDWAAPVKWVTRGGAP